MVDQFFTPDPDPGCGEELPQLARRGIEHFNRGEYFAAHEWLELAWREEPRPIRELYRGILQVGVAYYHFQRGNLRGAIRLLERAEGWLRQFPADCQGVDVAGLRRTATDVLRQLQQIEATGTALPVRLHPINCRTVKE